MSPHELVIRRLLGNDQREEIFVSTASLLEKLGRLPRGLRSMFAPLGLEWQRARTPVPGEIFVEPPREVHIEADEPEPAASAPAQIPEPAAPSPKVPACDPGLEDTAGSIEAAVMRTSSPSVEPSVVVAPPVTSSITIEAHNKDALAATVKRIVGVAREGQRPKRTRRMLHSSKTRASRSNGRRTSVRCSSS